MQPPHRVHPVDDDGDDEDSFTLTDDDDDDDPLNDSTGAVPTHNDQGNLSGVLAPTSEGDDNDDGDDAAGDFSGVSSATDASIELQRLQRERRVCWVGFGAV